MVRLLRMIRKENYNVLKKITMLIDQLAQQFKNNLTQETIEAFLSAPESPVNMKNEEEAIIQKVCEKEATTGSCLFTQRRFSTSAWTTTWRSRTGRSWG